MIFLFSGTGNTRYACEMLASITKDEVIDICSFAPADVKLTGNRVIIMFPIYAWGPAPAMVDFVNALPESFIESVIENDIPVSIICSCGDETGKGVDIMEKVLGKRGMNVKGAWSLIMPNVYVLLPGFDVDKKELSEEKLDRCVETINRIGNDLLSNRYTHEVTEGKFASLKTKVVYPLFRRWGINTKQWHWTKECIGCGKCAGACPVKNIVMKGGHPMWGTNCKSCLACYGICPTHAVAYGNITEYKGQYYCRRRFSNK